MSKYADKGKFKRGVNLLIDLSMLSGLPLVLENNKLIKFMDNSIVVEPSVRTYDAMQAVLARPKQGARPDNVLYWMYRDIALPHHRKAVEELGLRYDITVIKPGVINGEYIKTYGHYHPIKPGSVVTYPEVYEVLHGTALYILQKPGSDKEKIEQFMAVTARAGEKVVIPPNYGHVTVNIGSSVLVMANWVARNFSSEYDVVTKKQGAAYYAIKHSDGKPLFVFNQKYTQVISISAATAGEYKEFGLLTGKPMYTLIAEGPEKLDFLVNPEYYQCLFYKYGTGSSNIVWRPNLQGEVK